MERRPISSTREHSACASDVCRMLMLYDAHERFGERERAIEEAEERQDSIRWWVARHVDELRGPSLKSRSTLRHR